MPTLRPVEPALLYSLKIAGVVLIEESTALSKAPPPLFLFHQPSQRGYSQDLETRCGMELGPPAMLQQAFIKLPASLQRYSSKPGERWESRIGRRSGPLDITSSGV